MLPKKQTVVAEVCKETYSKRYDKNGVEKRPHVINPAKKGNTKRERKTILPEFSDYFISSFERTND